MIQTWLNAFRPRTLPLSLSTIWSGSFLAVYYGGHHWEITLMASLTTVFLQVLSNLANDYGDYSHGTDNAGRVGPARALQTGSIEPSAMKKAILVFAILSLVSGLMLLYMANRYVSWAALFSLLVVGLLSIVAAIKYTAGKNPYGYSGFGDIAVFVFFGLAGVLGAMYLHLGKIPVPSILIASSLGFLSTGVLNLNNIRDLAPDKSHGKRTLAVILGEGKARTYHLLLITLGAMGFLIFAILEFSEWEQWLFIIALPLLAFHINKFRMARNAQELDPLLKQLALATLFISLVFGLGIVLTRH